MAKEVKKPHAYPFFVALVGKSNEEGAMKGFDDADAANDDAVSRNDKALRMGLKARYEVRS
jgi:hypothetical protein